MYPSRRLDPSSAGITIDIGIETTIDEISTGEGKRQTQLGNIVERGDTGTSSGTRSPAWRPLLARTLAVQLTTSNWEPASIVRLPPIDQQLLQPGEPVRHQGGCGEFSIAEALGCASGSRTPTLESMPPIRGASRAARTTTTSVAP